jgi:hypothetical protein
LTLHRAVQTRVRSDILSTTPLRIQQMLAADLSQAEFQSIRRRVYDTVILGKGLNAGAADDESDDVATGANSNTLESFKKCNNCGNNDRTLSF